MRNLNSLCKISAFGNLCGIRLGYHITVGLINVLDGNSNLIIAILRPDPKVSHPHRREYGNKAKEHGNALDEFHFFAAGSVFCVKH